MRVGAAAGRVWVMGLGAGVASATLLAAGAASAQVYYGPGYPPTYYYPTAPQAEPAARYQAPPDSDSAAPAAPPSSAYAGAPTPAVDPAVSEDRPPSAEAPARVAADPAPRLPHRLIEAANAYAEFVRRASAIDAGFRSGAAVAQAVKTGAAYETHQFQEGAVAYAALTALQEPGFAQGVRALFRESGGGANLADRLAADPGAAFNIPGATLAAARAATALRRHGEHLVRAGSEVKQAAYTVQHSDWSKAQVADPDGRLAAAKVTSATRIELKGDEAPELLKAILTETPGDTAASGAPIVTRALAIAALAAVGQLQGDDDPRLAALLQERVSADCLKMAKLNLFQCLAVARPHYEDMFCLGEHAMMETGQCVVKAAGFTPIPPAPMTFAAASAPSR